jgi:hypothetical protein
MRIHRQVFYLPQQFAFARAAGFVIECCVTKQRLATVSLDGAQIQANLALGLDGRNPAQRDADNEPLVETAFAKLGRGDIGLGGKGSDFDPRREAAGDLNGNAAVAR